MQNKEPLSQQEIQWQQEAIAALIQGVYHIFDVHIIGTDRGTRQRARIQANTGRHNAQQSVMKRRTSNICRFTRI